MDSFEVNKVLAAVLVGALLFMGIKTLVGGSHDGHEVALAYTIEVAEEAGPAAVVDEGPSLPTLLASADIGKGERGFGACRACHSIEKGGPNKLGPNLYGILGRSVAAADGFGYSSALTEYGGEWTWERMDAWLKSPKNAVPGNAMSFNGVSKDNKRAELLVWLNAQSDTPLDLPAELVEEAVELAEEAASE